MHLATGAPVLPKDSLLYSEFMLLNELRNSAGSNLTETSPGQRAGKAAN